MFGRLGRRRPACKVRLAFATLEERAGQGLKKCLSHALLLATLGEGGGGGAPKNPCVVASTWGSGGGASKNTSNMCLAILVLYLHFVHMYMSHAVYKSFKLILARVVRQNVWLIDVLGLISVKMICSVSIVCSSVGQEIDYIITTRVLGRNGSRFTRG